MNDSGMFLNVPDHSSFIPQSVTPVHSASFGYILVHFGMSMQFLCSVTPTSSEVSERIIPGH